MDVSVATRLISAEAPRSRDAVKAVAIAVVGNALEWFDLVVYGFFAATIGTLFFPAADQTTSVVLALGTFGMSFLIRPLGAILIGRYADRVGRRAALVLVSSLMFVGTLIIAVLPTYETIGIWAPVLLFVARLIQGFSAGGEFGSATAYLAEHSSNRRAFFSSWQFASQGLATLMASCFGVLVTTQLSAADLQAWGWRLPFLFGLLIGPVAYLLRSHADESPAFREHLADRQAHPTGGWPPVSRVLIGVGATLVGTVSMYLMLYMPSYATTALKLPASAGFVATLTCGAVLVVLPPLVALRADRYGTLSVMLPATWLLVLLPWPVFAWMLQAPTVATLAVMQAILGIATAAYLSGLPAMLVALFPVEQRTLGLSLCYTITVVVAGGFAPMIFALLIRWTSNPAAPAGYVVLAAIVSLTSLYTIRRRSWIS